MSKVLQEWFATAAPRFEMLWFRLAEEMSLACQAPRLARTEFRERADSLAGQLANSSRPVLIGCKSATNFALAFCAALRAGREILLPPNLQPETLFSLEFQVADLLDDAFVSLPHPRSQLPPAAFDPQHPLTFFTSGSTGEPKRIRKTLRQLSAEIDTLESTFGDLLERAHVAATVPHIHIYGALFRVLWPLAAGRAFHDAPVFDQYGTSADGCVLVSSPAYLRRISDETFSNARPRVIFSSGGRLPDDDAVRIARVADCPLIEVYGSTESGGIAWRKWPCEDSGAGEWTAFDGVHLRIDGESSRLQVCSSATEGIWLDSGDIVEVRESGRFLLNGRADGVVKLEDKRISLTAIADWLEKHAWVAEARVVELRGRRAELGAVLRLNEAGIRVLSERPRREMTRRFREHVQQKFEAVVAPRKWRFVAEMPLNGMGKTTSADLIALFARSTT